MYKTLKKWNKLGYMVIRGERSRKRSKKGNPQFHHTQVMLINNPTMNYSIIDYDDGGWDNPDRFMPAQHCAED